MLCQLMRAVRLSRSLQVLSRCRGEQMMNTLQSFQDRPSSFVGAVRQLSGLTVGSWRGGLVHNWKLSLEMSHVSVHLNFKPGNTHWRTACRSPTVPINPHFNILVNRDNHQWGICSFLTRGMLGNFSMRICRRQTSVLYKYIILWKKHSCFSVFANCVTD